MNTFNFGISSWSYPWSIGVAKGLQPVKKMSAIELVQRAIDLDVSLVQIADNLPLEQLDITELEELVNFTRKNQIQIEVGTKGIEVEHLLHFLQIAQKLESPILRTLPALFGKKAIWDEVRKNITAVLPEFEKAGITIVLENTEAFHVQEYVDIIKSINHPNFKLCVDLANALGIMEGPEYVMDQMLPHCGNYHFKDVYVERSETLMGFTVYGAPSGKGQLSLPLVLEKLEALNLNPSVIIELWPPLQNSIEETIQLEHNWVEESIKYVRKTLNQNSALG